MTSTMQQQYPNPQSYIQPPQAPRSKIRPWMWIVGSVVVFVGVFVWIAISNWSKFWSENARRT